MAFCLADLRHAKDCQNMLTTIEHEGQRLNLRTEGSENLFDVDSVSLIIGPNGSGKSVFLKQTIEMFAPRNAPQFDTDSRLVFNHDEAFLPQPESWGLVYYTPVRNRPVFRKQPRFTDASVASNLDLFQIYSHQALIEGFGIKVALVAKLRADVKKVRDFYANALIDDRKGIYTQRTHDSIPNLRKWDIATKNFSDFTGNRQELEARKKQHKAEFDRLSLAVLDDIHDSFAHRRDSEKRLTAFCATVHHLQLTQRYDFAVYLDLLTHLTDSRYFTPLPLSDKQAEDSAQARETFQHILTTLRRLNFERRSASVLEFKVTDASQARYFTGRREGIFEISLPGSSSGQWAIINQVVSLYNVIKDMMTDHPQVRNLLVMIDEGDAFLHLAWQRRYILEINRFLSDCKAEFNIPNLQLIIASHSPLLASDVPAEFVCQLPDPEGHAPLTDRHPSFAAPLHAMLNLSFGASTIGEFATRTINATIANLRTGNLSPRDEYLISVVDDPVIQRELQRMARRETTS